MGRTGSSCRASNSLTSENSSGSGTMRSRTTTFALPETAELMSTFGVIVMSRRPLVNAATCVKAPWPCAASTITRHVSSPSCDSASVIRGCTTAVLTWKGRSNRYSIHASLPESVGFRCRTAPSISEMLSLANETASSAAPS